MSGVPGTLDTSNGLSFPAQPRSVLLLGKVQLEGGGSPGEPVRIERVCNGITKAEGFTDMKGNFSITLGEEQTAMAGATEAPSRNAVALARGPNTGSLAGCELRASLAGYRSDVVPLTDRRYLDNPNLGIIFLHPLSNVAGLTISATTALAPKDARKAYEKGLDAEHKSKPDEAQKEFEKAVEIYSRFAAAWYEAGKIYEQRDHMDQARNAYTQALAADPKYLNPYVRLYFMAFRAGQWQDAADFTDRLVRLDPIDYPEAFYYNAVANLQLTRLDAAEKSAREAVALDTAHRDAKSQYTLGYILAQKGNFAESARYLRTYLEIEPNGKQSDTVRKQLEEVERAAESQQR